MFKASCVLSINFEELLGMASILAICVEVSGIFAISTLGRAIF